MALHQRCGNEVGLLHRQRIVNGLCLHCVGNNADDRFAIHDLLAGHGDRLLICGILVFKPALVQLLLNAGVREVNHLVESGVLEIGGRIVKGNMAVFSDADQAEVDAALCQASGNLCDRCFGIALARERWNFPGCTTLMKRSFRYFWKDAGCSSEMPTYSSR